MCFEGYSIKSYRDEESIPLLVNKIFSDNTPLQYAYYDLPFVCPPTGKKTPSSPFGSGHSISLNLGEVLRGDRIKTSDFEISMGKDVECQHLCDREITRNDVKWAKELISNSYVTEWILDNLPGATRFVTVDRSQRYYASGFKLGYQDFSPVDGKRKYFLNNHFTFVIRWRDAPGKAGGKVIVGFEVYPKSIPATSRLESGCPKEVQGEYEGLELHLAPNNTRLAEKYPGSSYLPEEDLDVDDGATLSIPYTYSVYFRKDNSIEWSNRWDLYFNSQNDSSYAHWLALVNAVIIAGILGVTVVVIWSRTVQGDVKGRGDGVAEEGKVKLRSRKSKSGLKSPRSEKPSNGLLDQNGDREGEDSFSDEELDDVSGWKLLHGDVFRTPMFSGLLAPLVGSGMQLLFMTTGLLALSCLGVLNPSFRGGFVSVGIGLFVFAGLFSGYYSARIYKSFGGQNWRKNMMITALLFPGLLFSQVFVLNLFVWAQASSTALPFGTLVGLAALWLLIQLPLVYVGSWFGYVRAKPWEHPTRTNAIARQIPRRSWSLGFMRALAAGLVPFAVLFVELLFVFRNLLQDKSGHYYVFGYLSVISVVLLITISEMTIITTYSQLCAENHHWWWQSFLTGGSSAFWIFMYCIWYYFMKLNVHGFMSSLLFFSYSFLGCAVYGLLTGTVGFLTAYAFIRRIYSSVKVD
ncbi:hypothetical protein AJ80_04871 [Polytolypa hystricis UAMH7299]|uniref:Transmembrane 9 superfamily member n=1 Tax=Polytolypa hystricis (strain UAMH7299) TaxID=1447883 RepID=A0A2B7Y802_POLH7|nr:hypothetical protein AJ80_04871 [Polytolypa hystricis UAMH7299]